MADHLAELVKMLKEAHGTNLKSVVLYGSAVAGDNISHDARKHILVVLDRIAPEDLKAAHPVAESWRLHGNPLPVYFTSAEIADSSDVFPIEFIDMSQVHRVLYGNDIFQGLDIPTTNLRHQLEYEMRSKLLRLRTLYTSVAEKPDRLARLMADSLDSFAVLFRHVLLMMGKSAPVDKGEAVISLAHALGLDQKVYRRIFEYAEDEEIWLEGETNQTFAAYLAEIERVIEYINKVAHE